MIRVREVIEVLRERGDGDEATYLETIIPLELMVVHNMTYDEVMEMSVDELEAWYKTPPKPMKYDGWNFWWGASAK